MLKEKEELLINTLIKNQYRILQKIGEGGMGSVFLADQISVKRKVALKILDFTIVDEPSIIRFEQESKAITQLSHPNILTVYDYGQDIDAGIIYLVMEYLEGHTLTEKILSTTRLEMKFVLDIGVQMCEALGYAHSKGIIHRDLKPDNIFLVKRGRKWMSIILDFGVSKLLEGHHKLTKPGYIVGTPAYMAPEQAKAAMKVDKRADIYSMGCILYEMATGKIPFQCNTFVEFITAHLSKEPRLPSQVRPDWGIHRELDQTIMKTLAKHPDGRFQDAYAFADRLSYIKSLVGADKTISFEDTGEFQPISLSNNRASAIPKTVSDGAQLDQKRSSKIGLLSIKWVAIIVAILIFGAIGFALLYSNRYESTPSKNQKVLLTTETSVLVLPFKHSGPDRSYNPEAVDLYLKGRYLLEKLYDTGQRHYIEESEKTLKKVIDLDENFVDAYISLARTYWQYINFGYSTDPKYLKRALQTIEKAIQLDGSNYEAYAQKTYILLQMGQKDQAITTIKKAIRLAPTAQSVMKAANIIYDLCGLGPKAEVLLHKLQSYYVNPNIAQAYLAYNYLNRGQFEKGKDILEKLHKKEPYNESIRYFLSLMYRYIGHHAKGAQIGEEFLKNNPDSGNFKTLLAMHYAALGKHNRALVYLNQIEDFGRIDFNAAYAIACTYALMGKMDRMFYWLDMTLQRGNDNFPLLNADPCFDKLRTNSQFQAFEQKMKTRWMSYRDLKFFEWEQ